MHQRTKPGTSANIKLARWLVRLQAHRQEAVVMVKRTKTMVAVGTLTLALSGTSTGPACARP